MIASVDQKSINEQKFQWEGQVVVTIVVRPNRHRFVLLAIGVGLDFAYARRVLLFTLT